MANGRPEFFDESPLTQQTRSQERAESIFNPQGQTGVQAKSEQDELEERRISESLQDQFNRAIVVDKAPPTIGRVVLPRSASYQAFEKIHDTPAFDAKFSIFNYELFDKVVAENAGLQELTNERHLNTEEYKALRKNIAIVRNFIYSQFFPDGAYHQMDPEDRANIQRLPQIARLLGEALRHGKHGKAAGMNSLDLNVANTPDSGAVAIYEHILKLQNERTLWHPVSMLLDKPNYDWRLPPVEDSAFSTAHMKMNQLGVMPWYDADPDNSTKAERLVTLGMQLDYTRVQMDSVERLEQPVKDEAIYYAKKILENFRITAGSNRENANLAKNNDDEVLQTERLLDVAVIYKDLFHMLTDADPSLRANPELRAAKDAIGKLVYLTKLQAVEDFINEGNPNAAQILTEIIDRMPGQNKQMNGETYTELVNKLESGLDEIARIKGLPTRSLEKIREIRPRTEPATTVSEMNAADREYLQRMNQAFQSPPAQTIEEARLRQQRANLTSPKSQAVMEEVRSDLLHTMPEANITQVSNPQAVNIACRANERAAPVLPEKPLAEPVLQTR